jgi:hypothetical protein
MRSFRQSLFVSVCALTLSVACGDDGSGGSGNQGGTGATGGTGGTPSDGGTGAVGATGGTGGTGAGTPVIPCIEVEASADCTDPNNTECLCNGCDGFAECASDAGIADCVCSVCAEDSFCANPSNCTDDGLCDPYNEGCICADCAAHPECAGQLEDCTNGTDDNGNGDVDCDDSQCFQQMACEEDCANDMDDNGNTLIDCADPIYCAFEVTCQEEGCMTPTTLMAGTTMGDTTNGTNFITSSCANLGAKEVVYTFTPTVTGFLKITLTAADDDLGFSVRTTCADIETQLACADAEEAGTDEVGIVEVTTGTAITIIVDGFDPMQEGPFSLTLVETADGGCLDDMACSADVGEACTCADCTTSPVCGFCDADQMDCAIEEACTCDSCDTDMFCTDPANCTDDGFCNQFVEGCQCADCTNVPNCAN